MATRKPQTEAQINVDALLHRFDVHEERTEAQAHEITDRFESLRGRIEEVSTKVTAHIAAEDADRELLVEVKRFAFGNGHDGADVRLDRMEDWRDRMDKDEPSSIRMDRLEEWRKSLDRERPLPTRLDRLEQWQLRLRYVLTGILIPAVMWGVYAGISQIAHWIMK